MKRLMMIIALAAMLVIAGCGKEPADVKNQPISQQQPPATPDSAPQQPAGNLHPVDEGSDLDMVAEDEVDIGELV